MAILGTPRLPQKTFRTVAPYPASCVIKYTGGHALSLQRLHTCTKFLLGIFRPFGELTGALWRLPLAGVARTRKFVLGVAVDSTKQRHLASALQLRTRSRG